MAEKPLHKSIPDSLSGQRLDQALADVLWERIQPHVVPSITINEGDDRWERGAATGAA